MTDHIQHHQVVHNARHAGAVRRYHTWPILRDQSVGEHCWQLCRIYYQIWGELPPDVSTYIIWHDAAELAVGDLPFQIKRDNHTLKRELDKLEGTAMRNMGGPSMLLSPVMLDRVKLCDLIDMWEYGIDEHRMGNQYAWPIIDDIGDKILTRLKDMSEELRRPITDYLTRASITYWLAFSHKLLVAAA
jgi:hypothetical protein